MKRIALLLAILILFAGLFAVPDAAAKRMVYTASALTGGSTDYLDGYNGAYLNDGDWAFVAAGGYIYFYILDADSAATESSPTVIKPDSSAGDKRWILQTVYTAPGSLMVYPGAGVPNSTGSAWGTSYTFSTNASLGTSDTTLSSQKAIKTYIDAKFGTLTNTFICTYNASTGKVDCNTDPSGLGTGDFLADGSVAMTGTLNAAKGLQVRNGTSPGYIQLYEGSGNGTDYSSITGGADAGSYPSVVFSGSAGSGPTLYFEAGSGKWTFHTGASGDTLAMTPLLTLNGGLALGATNLTMTGSIGATGARVTKGWFTDAEFTNPPTIGGNAMPAYTPPGSSTPLCGDSSSVGACTNLTDVAPIAGTLGTTANVIPKASGTGGKTAQASGITENGTDVLLGALNLYATGHITGKVKVISKSSAYTLGTDDARELYGSVVLATGAMTLTLPAAGDADVGMGFCIYSTTAAVIRVNPQDADKIRLGGTLGAAGVDIYSDGTAGAFVCLLLTDSSSDVAAWTVLGVSGVWAAGS